jgi:hypothetical protein
VADDSINRNRVTKGSALISNEVPVWPAWLVEALGVDAFGSVREVILGRPTTEPPSEAINRAFVGIGNLEGLLASNA